MKRCTTCGRVESDDTLGFCRADGTPLVSYSGSLTTDQDPANLGTGPPASEIETSLLPHTTTGSSVDSSTPPTNVLDRASTVANLSTFRWTKAKALTGVAILIVAIIALLNYYNRGNNSVPINSIAVLPFQNATGDSNMEYLSDGLAESLMNSFSQLPGLKVMSRNSAFRYKGREHDAATIGKDLNVRAVLSGSLKKIGDRIVVNVSLDDTSDNHQIWGGQYDRTVSDLLTVQREIARDVTANLRPRLSSGSVNPPSRRYTQNPEAYELYLKGRFFWNKRNADALRKSIEYFNQAIEKDPAYALAYAGLADSYVVQSGYSASAPSEAYPKAKAAAKKALELDETLAEAHASLALSVHDYDLNFPEAEKEFKRSIELDPNYATAHHWYSYGLLRGAGRFDEALAEMKKAQELDPLSLIINAELGSVYLSGRQYDKAIEASQKAIEMDQGFYFARCILGQAFQANGQMSEAVSEYQKAIELNDDPYALALLGQARALTGKRDEAIKILKQLEEISKTRYVSAFHFALIHQSLGNKDQAFQWLERVITIAMRG